MLRLVAFGVLLVAFASGQSTQVSRCTQNGGELPINAYIAGCTVPPCGLPQLENAVITMVFKTPRVMRRMTTLATAYLSLFGIPAVVPYPLRENAVTCNFLDNSYCPLLEGEIVQYTLHMYIETTFQVGISPTIEFRITDDDNVPFVCIRVPVTIQNPRTRTHHNGTLAIPAK